MVEQISSSPLEFIPQKPIKENIGINELIAGKSLDINLLNKLLNKEKDKEKQLSLLNYIETNNLINADSLKIIQNLLKNKSGHIRATALRILHENNIISYDELHEKFLQNNKDAKTKAEAIRLLSSYGYATLHNSFKTLLETENSEIVKLSALKAIGANFKDKDFPQIIEIANLAENPKLKHNALKILIENIDNFDQSQQSKVEHLLYRIINKNDYNTETKITAIKALEELLGKTIKINNYTTTLDSIMEKETEEIKVRELAAKKYFFQKKDSLSVRKEEKAFSKIKSYIDTLFRNEENIYSDQNNELFKLENHESFDRLLKIYKKALNRRERIEKQIERKGRENINSELLFELDNDKSFKLRKKIIKYLIEHDQIDKLKNLKDPNLEIQALIENPETIKRQTDKISIEKAVKYLHPYDDYEKIIEILQTKGKEEQMQAIKLLAKNNLVKVEKDLMDFYQNSLDSDIKILILNVLAERPSEEINTLLEDQAANNSDKQIKDEANNIIELRLEKFLM